ncbi:hypothetical protein [Oligoflexus tunisiensis]|uniref:hypothetical protein n=1 Tax=Oligoflexus tunisiensis TaxID=708132 RepID=UPI00114C9E6E|nr:hypothetical protein [Oligoflexus tunisiensis]
MGLIRSIAAALSLIALPTSISAEVHKLTEKEYQQFIDELIGAIEKGTVGVGGGNGGSQGSGTSPGSGSGENSDDDPGNDDSGDGIGESW